MSTINEDRGQTGSRGDSAPIHSSLNSARDYVVEYRFGGWWVLDSAVTEGPMPAVAGPFGSRPIAVKWVREAQSLDRVIEDTP